MKRLFIHHSSWRKLPIAFADLGIFVLSLTAAVAVRQAQLVAPELLLSFLPIFWLSIGVLYTVGLYDLRLVRDFPSLVRSLLVSAGLCVFAGMAYFYLFSPKAATAPKTILLLTVGFSHALLLGGRRLWLWILDYQFTNHHIAFLGEPAGIAKIRHAAEERRAELGQGHAQPGRGADLVVADARWVEEHWDEAKDILGEAIRSGVPVVSFENFYESLTGKVSPEYAGNPSWSLEFVLPKSQGAYPIFKRLFDVAAGAVLLLLLSPVLIAIHLAIRLGGHSPIYGQRRVGFLGKEFTLYKFRTMRHGADQGGAFAQAPGPDGRVTRLGRWLRRFRLDELPQLYNVLRGDMSLVGPRPEWIKEVEVLEQEVPHYHLRHLVPPGITGWAQVYFRATNSPNDSVEKHHYDLYYLKYFSFALDFAILLKTLKRVLVSDQDMPAAHASPLPGRSRKGPDMSSVISRN